MIGNREEEKGTRQNQIIYYMYITYVKISSLKIGMPAILII